MITLSQVKKKINKIWESHAFQAAYLKGEPYFPLVISLPRLSAESLWQDFSAIRAWVKELQNYFGYQLKLNEINHRQLGLQSLPIAIELDQENFLRFANKEREFRLFCETADIILIKQPRLKEWIQQNPTDILAYQATWPALLAVCEFLQKNPQPNCYLRELSIPLVDTKFIEQHKKILSKLLDNLLPPAAINQRASSGTHFFEERYGFRFDEKLIRFRTKQHPLIRDISIPLSEFRLLHWPSTRVFVTENKINGLTFPLKKDDMIIFGLGYGIQSLRDIEWLKEKEIIYWGDIDTHGFAILSQLRSYYPQTKSILMDELTLLHFSHLWVSESLDKRCTATLAHLTPSEQLIYEKLKCNLLGDSIRLEQERIDLNYMIKEAMHEYQENKKEKS